ncbi:MAG: transcription antitermination factor NusB [bacterium]
MAKEPTQAAFVQKRALARMAAVQALYQMEHAQTGLNKIIDEYKDYQQDIDGQGEGRAIHQADFAFFENILRGVIDSQESLDRAIEKKLADGWTLKRLDATTRAILRCGAWELAMLADMPAKVSINEYIDVAHAFFEDESKEPAFINAILDGLSHYRLSAN